VTVRHHDGCFGCGQANLFGLQLELEVDESDGSVSGRFFLKQDHQGPPGVGHGGILATALDEAMALAMHAADVPALTHRLKTEFRAPVPVGTFVHVKATIDHRGDRRWIASATAADPEGTVVARAKGEFAVVQ
jgi:acyl-coenzyme A thioesterase PaaI-like protein